VRDHRRRLEKVEERLQPPPVFVTIRLNDPATGEELPGAREAIARAHAEGKTPVVIVRSILGGPRPPDYPADVTIRIPRPSHRSGPPAPVEADREDAAAGCEAVEVESAGKQRLGQCPDLV